MANLIPTYFFLNKKLHKLMAIIKSEDVVIAFSFPDEKNIRYLYTQVRKNYESAYNVSQVSELLGRPVKEIKDLMIRGLAEFPSGKAYAIKTQRPTKSYWSQEDVIALREAMLATVSKDKYGFPNKNYKIVSPSELLAKMRGDTATYAKTPDGKFIKVWKAI